MDFPSMKWVDTGMVYECTHDESKHGAVIQVKDTCSVKLIPFPHDACIFGDSCHFSTDWVSGGFTKYSFFN